MGWKLIMLIVLPLNLAQPDSLHRDNAVVDRCILEFCGVEHLEDMDEDELERFRHYAAHPIQINLANRSRLLSSGLFTPYRVVTLLDWRQCNGDILSLAELATVDGFGRDFVALLSPFIDFESVLLPGQSPPGRHRIENELVTRSSLKFQKGTADWALSSKYSFTLDDRFEAGVAFKAPYGTPHSHPDAGAFHLSYSGRRFLSSAVVGAFQCRFGQGLCLWSGFSLSSADKTASVSRNPTFVSAYRGFDDSSALKGAVATFSAGHFAFSALVAHPGMGAANVSWFSMRGQMGLTAFYAHGKSSKCSVDCRWNFRGVDVFGEFAFDIYNKSPAALAGVRSSFGSYVKLSLLTRFYPKSFSPDYSGAVRGGSKCSDDIGGLVIGDWRSRDRRHDGNFSLDVMCKPSKFNGAVFSYPLQIKSSAIWNWQFGKYLSLNSKLSYRFRGYENLHHRTEARSDLKFVSDSWTASIRLNAVYSSALAGLFYADCQRIFVWPSSLKLSLYARLGCFHADKWADRIYCYERDVPGSFNVPAYYGRGLNAAMMCGLAFPFGLKIYARAATLQYPGDSSRAGKTEVRMLLSIDI